MQAWREHTEHGAKGEHPQAIQLNTSERPAKEQERERHSQGHPCRKPTILRLDRAPPYYSARGCDFARSLLHRMIGSIPSTTVSDIAAP